MEYNKYHKGKIYKIIDNTNNEIYIGSTIRSLKRRLREHLDQKDDDCNRITKRIINNNNYDIQLIENYPCQNKIELIKREQFWIDNTDCINIKKAFVAENKKDYDKIRYQENKDEIKEKTNKLYYYQSSWGGDKRSNNNLLCIDINVFN